jgi:hypothetical protein
MMIFISHMQARVLLKLADQGAFSEKSALSRFEFVYIFFVYIHPVFVYIYIYIYIRLVLCIYIQYVCIYVQYVCIYVPGTNKAYISQLVVGLVHLRIYVYITTAK